MGVIFKLEHFLVSFVLLVSWYVWIF